MKLHKMFNNVDIEGYRQQHPALSRYVKKEMAKRGRQFLLIGDTHHGSADLIDFFNSPALPALLRYAGIPRFCYELPREISDPDAYNKYTALIEGGASGKKFRKSERAYWNSFIDRLRHIYNGTPLEERESLPLSAFDTRRYNILRKQKKGKIGKKEARRALKKVDRKHAKALRNLWGVHALGFPHAGIDTFAVDSIQWRTNLIQNLYLRVFIGDHEISNEVRAKAGDRKTALLYGQYHFAFEGGLGSRFSEKEALRIDVYPDKLSYQEWLIRRKEHHDILPDRIYFLAERELAEPDTELEQGILSKRNYSEWARWQEYVEGHYKEDDMTDHAREEIAKITQLPHIDPRFFCYKPPVRTLRHIDINTRGFQQR